MNNYKLGINTILKTKDGRKIGNAIIVRKIPKHWVIRTDYGIEVAMTEEEIHNWFTIGWIDFTKENNGFDCEEMQTIMAENHKHRVETPVTSTPLSDQS